jgi:sigma-E factor negative regulatory protein RseC
VTESEAIVTRLDGEYAWVNLQSGCTTCEQTGGCGLSDGKGKPPQRLLNGIGARVGDQVVLTVPDGAVLRAALYCYLLPLAMMLALAAGGMAIADETGAVLGALGGLGLGWTAMRMAGQREPVPSMRLKHAVVQLQRN